MCVALSVEKVSAIPFLSIVNTWGFTLSTLQDLVVSISRKWRQIQEEFALFNGEYVHEYTLNAPMHWKV